MSQPLNAVDSGDSVVTTVGETDVAQELDALRLLEKELRNELNQLQVN